MRINHTPPHFSDKVWNPNLTSRVPIMVALQKKKKEKNVLASLATLIRYLPPMERPFSKGKKASQMHSWSRRIWFYLRRYHNSYTWIWWWTSLTGLEWLRPRVRTSWGCISKVLATTNRRLASFVWVMSENLAGGIIDPEPNLKLWAKKLQTKQDCYEKAHLASQKKVEESQKRHLSFGLPAKRPKIWKACYSQEIGSSSGKWVLLLLHQQLLSQLTPPIGGPFNSSDGGRRKFQSLNGADSWQRGEALGVLRRATWMTGSSAAFSPFVQWRPLIEQQLMIE